jgi:hypothetical protein
MFKRGIVLVLFLMASCMQPASEPVVYQIDADFLVYVKSFVEEAKKRGIVIKEENLIIKFGNTPDDICGQCKNPQNGGQRIITISQDADCWTQMPKENQEALVFHELGHCFLGRQHRDDLLPNGDPASIMNSQNNGPYEPCLYPIGNDPNCNKTSRRSYYIDELFNPQIPVPAWAK